MRATARAGTNIALVKYWGKRDAALNLPAAGSLSLTLDGLTTTTTVTFGRGQRTRRSADVVDVIFEGDRRADAAFARRASRFLDLVRAQARLDAPAEIHTSNTFPTGSGLASSASGFAALALAATRAAGLDLDAGRLSELARRGSGSAARSVHGGFVEMAAGVRADGTDAIARPLLRPNAWPVRLVVAVTTTGQKGIGSTAAMKSTAASSPYYPAWIASVPRDLEEARAAISARDLERLGTVTERSALRMHASALAAEPGILYWNAATVAAMHAVRDLRQAGTLAFFTIDAGPHVKVLCHKRDATKVADALARVPGVLCTLTAAPGAGATLLDEP